MEDMVAGNVSVRESKSCDVVNGDGDETQSSLLLLVDTPLPLGQVLPLLSKFSV